MKHKLMMTILSISLGLSFSQTSIATETMAHSASLGSASLDSANPSSANIGSLNLGNTPMEGTETFKAFGGKAGLVAIMDDFMIGLVADPRTTRFFNNDKQAFIKAMLVEQMCELMNGGCQYAGRDMKTTHANMKVNREAFNALVEQFQFAMDKHNVPFSAQNKLLAKLAPMYREIESTTGDAVPPKAASN